MPLSIKVNLRVTGHCNQGGRKYMEDMFSVAYQQTSDDKDLEYAFFGIFDGHGGGEAATFAKEHLMDIIVKQRNFWSDKDEDVLRAIRDGYVNTHYAMWRELDKWPTTASGLPSTAGTTASVAFIRKGKIYIGHVGDSGIILGYQEEGDPQWKAKALTKDHKPESGSEMTRIQESGGKVVSKSGVPRVVWNRPRIGHKGPVRRSTHIDEIPFLAVARSLGDLWSYNSELDTFVVSPEPDVKVVTVDVKSQRCLIFGTDGLWNMLTPQAAVAIVQSAERHNEKHLIASQQTGNGQADVQMWINPSKSLVDTALERWFSTRLRADNTSVVTLMLDPPGPSRSEVLMSRKNERAASPKNTPTPLACARTPSMRTENPIEPLERPITSTLPRDDAPESKKPDTSDNSKKSCIVNEKCDAIADSPKKSSDDDRIIEKKNEPEVTLASTSRESIQVPEISSSDAFVENQGSPIAEINNEIVETTEQSSITNNNENQEISTNDTTKLSRDTTPDIKVAIGEEKSTEKCPVSKNKDGLSPLVRQNAFCGSCEELQSRPRLRRSLGPFGTVNRPLNRDTGKEQKEPMSGIPSRRKSQSATTINSHLESRSVRRRQSVNSTTVSYIADRQKSYFSARLKRDSLGITRSIDTIHDNKRTTGNTKINAKINTKINDAIVGSKRRHSSTSERPEEPVRTIPEPTAKRRTRSEDRPSPTDENDPANQSKQSQQQQQQQQQHSRLRWPEDSISSLRSRSGSTSTSCVATSVASQEKITSPNSYQRRSLEKKATPVKTIRRPSINGSSRVQLRGSFALREWDQSKNGRRNSCSNHARLNRTVPGVVGSTSDSSTSSSSPLPSLQRWLRSDTLAATPVKTLRSRNVDITGHTVPAQIAYQYDIVKPNRLSLSSKIKLNGAKVGKPTSSSMSTGKLNKQSVNGAVVANGIDVVTTTTTTTTNTTMSSSGTSSVIAKRVKSPYNANARSALGTRSRLKRLGK